eukprot:1974948-Pleurochrysis_carterae.AAC.4
MSGTSPIRAAAHRDGVGVRVKRWLRNAQIRTCRAGLRGPLRSRRRRLRARARRGSAADRSCMHVFLTPIASLCKERYGGPASRGGRAVEVCKRVGAALGGVGRVGSPRPSAAALLCERENGRLRGAQHAGVLRAKWLREQQLRRSPWLHRDRGAAHRRMHVVGLSAWELSSSAS